MAIVSDIHGNRHAFEAVLDAIADSGCEELWCLGDLVGYGADPDACVALAREHAAICLAGNHDLGVRGSLPLEEFSRGAALAATWTQETHLARDPRLSRRLEPQNARRAGRALPRQPPRPGVGVRPLAAAGRAVPRRPGPADLADRPFPRGAVVLALPGDSGHRPDPRRRGGAEPDRRRVADQPRQRRPAPRRRSARRLARARSRRLAGACSGAPSTTSRAPRRRSGPPSCPIRWPSACSTGSDAT